MSPLFERSSNANFPEALRPFRGAPGVDILDGPRGRLEERGGKPAGEGLPGAAEGGRGGRLRRIQEEHDEGSPGGDRQADQGIRDGSEEGDGVPEDDVADGPEAHGPEGGWQEGDTRR